ncbi:hypothetical protein [Bacillus kwashiorkori]|uniref:hypothetical protein n=1 Tax=Bacillus kwashiorkori TaxID=1522318 RepID=UPI0008F82643|nr:hypothetical protein [Bacillus kwashiorkori]
MKIVKYYGYEMEKETKTSFQDYFNESIVEYIEDFQKKTLSVTYLRFFEENILQFTPFETNPLFSVGDQPIFLYDIVALVALQIPEYKNRKRLFINNEAEFSELFTNCNKEQIYETCQQLHKN